MHILIHYNSCSLIKYAVIYFQSETDLFLIASIMVANFIVSKEKSMNLSILSVCKIIDFHQYSSSTSILMGQFLAATSSSRKDSVRACVHVCVHNVFLKYALQVKGDSGNVKGTK